MFRPFFNLLGTVILAWLTPELRVSTERITGDLKMVHLWDYCLLEILNLTPKGDHLSVAQAFCDP